MNLEPCLPAELRGPTTTITKISAGLSGAGVHRVETGESANRRTFVLKIAGTDVSLASWRSKVELQRLAAEAGVAPRVIHIDEERRAVVSEYIASQSLPARLGDPRTRDAAIVEIGETVRRVHDIPLPVGAVPTEPLQSLARIAGALAGFAMPAFVDDAIRRVQAEPPPDPGRALVLSHNDANPTNLAHDGERLRFVDWDTAAPNEPFFDLAALAVFLRFDDATCLRLLSAYDRAPVTALPERFMYDRRVVAAMCGGAFLHLARTAGHTGAKGDETLDTTLSLPDFYQRLRTGALSPATPDGQWAFGLALIKASLEL